MRLPVRNLSLHGVEGICWQVAEVGGCTIIHTIKYSIGGWVAAETQSERHHQTP